MFGFELGDEKKRVVGLLNQILEFELAGVVRYTHYSFMVFGYSRLPLVEWLRAQATESLTHAQEAGELITQLGEHPSLGIGKMLETHAHSVEDLLKESLQHEENALRLYQDLRTVVEGKSIVLEEYARRMLEQEIRHVGEVDKMLRKPGELQPYGS